MALLVIKVFLGWHQFLTGVMLISRSLVGLTFLGETCAQNLSSENTALWVLQASQRQQPEPKVNDPWEPLLGPQIQALSR